MRCHSIHTMEHLSFSWSSERGVVSLLLFFFIGTFCLGMRLPWTPANQASFWAGLPWPYYSLCSMSILSFLFDWHKVLWGGQYILYSSHFIEEDTCSEHGGHHCRKRWRLSGEKGACVSSPTRVSVRLSTGGRCAVKMSWKESWGLNVGQCAGAFLSPFAGLKHGSIYLLSFMTVDQEKLAPLGTHQSGLVSPLKLSVCWKLWWRFSSLISKPFINWICLWIRALTWK